VIPIYKKILVATDLTPNSAHALRHAVGLARAHQGQITLLHVIPDVEPAVLNLVATAMGGNKLTDYELAHKADIKEQIQARLQEFAAEELNDHPGDLGLISSIEIHHGHAVAMILEVADDLEVDLIVLGSHGKGPVHYAFLGSVAEKVLRKSHRPVLVVPLGP